MTLPAAMGTDSCPVTLQGSSIAEYKDTRLVQHLFRGEAGGSVNQLRPDRRHRQRENRRGRRRERRWWIREGG